MRRDLTDRFTFGDEDEYTLTHGESLQNGEQICDWYEIGDMTRYIRYVPAEFAELRAAIDEMLRMRDQHRDALTDGAGEQVAEPFLATAPLLIEAERNALAVLLYGALMSSAADHFSVLHGHRLIEAIPRSEWVKRGADWYGISAKGRAFLDAQEPEAEDGLDAMDLAILQDLAEPGERLISVEGGSGLIWGLSGKDSSFTHNYLSLLYKRKLIHFASAEEQTEDLKASYHISDAGRAVLTEQEA